MKIRCNLLPVHGPAGCQPQLGTSNGVVDKERCAQPGDDTHETLCNVSVVERVVFGGALSELAR